MDDAFAMNGPRISPHHSSAALLPRNRGMDLSSGRSAIVQTRAARNFFHIAVVISSSQHSTDNALASNAGTPQTLAGTDRQTSHADPFLCPLIMSVPANRSRETTGPAAIV